MVSGSPCGCAGALRQISYKGSFKNNFTFSQLSFGSSSKYATIPPLIDQRQWGKIIVAEHQPDRIILFGSHAKGDDRIGSDYDLLVLKKGAKRERSLTHKIYLSFKDIGAPVDMIVADLDKYEQLKTDPYLIYSEADKSGRMVYEDLIFSLL